MIRYSAFLIVLLGAVPARSQYMPQPRPISPPALSPYLNLMRGGSPAVNYYLGVQPEFERRAQMFQDRMGDPRSQAAPAPEPPPDDLIPALSQTGHGVGFQYYGGYYSFGLGQGQKGATSQQPRRR